MAIRFSISAVLWFRTDTCNPSFNFENIVPGSDGTPTGFVDDVYTASIIVSAVSSCSGRRRCSTVSRRIRSSTSVGLLTSVTSLAQRLRTSRDLTRRCVPNSSWLSASDAASFYHHLLDIISANTLTRSVHMLPNTYFRPRNGASNCT